MKLYIPELDKLIDYMADFTIADNEMLGMIKRIPRYKHYFYFNEETKVWQCNQQGLKVLKLTLKAYYEENQDFYNKINRGVNTVEYEGKTLLITAGGIDWQAHYDLDDQDDKGYYDITCFLVDINGNRYIQWFELEMGIEQPEAVMLLIEENILYLYHDLNSNNETDIEEIK